MMEAIPYGHAQADYYIIIVQACGRLGPSGTPGEVCGSGNRWL